MKQKTGSVLLILMLVVVLAGLGIAAFFVLSKPSPTVTPGTKSGELSSTALKGDINRDGKVDVEDADLIRKASPCNHTEPCWTKVVGKTKDGDNPIYASDLDINHDDNVNQMDVSALSAQ